MKLSFFKSKKKTPDLAKVSKTNTVNINIDNFFRTDLDNYRYSDPNTALLKLSKYDPDVSNAMLALIANANTSLSYVARDFNGKISTSATKRLKQIVTVLDRTNLTENKWDYKLSLDSLINGLIKYSFVRGGVALEVELGKDRMPVNLWLVDPIRIEFLHPENGRYVPIIKSSDGKNVSLDIPTFFYEPIVPEADDPYAYSLILPVLETVFFSLEVIRDLRRVMQKFGYPKYNVKVLMDILVKNAPAHIKLDAIKLKEFIDEKFNEIVSTLENNKPGDAFVFSDFVEVELLESNADAKVDFRPIIQILDQKISSSLKTLPTILGRTIGKGASKEEVVLYAKVIKLYQKHVSMVLSKVFTLILRLMGVQAYADFKFSPVDLRSETEVENHKMMKQKRLIEAVQLGWVDDYEACYEMYGELPVQESGIFGQYAIFNSNNGSLFPVEGVGSDSPYNSRVGSDRERRNDNEDIVSEGAEPSDNSEVTGV